jgi:indole-3-glycerol phosphate synthase
MATKELTPQLDVIVAAKRQYVLERKSQTPIEAVRALASMQKRPLPMLNTIPESDEAPVMIIGQLRRAVETVPAELSHAAKNMIQTGVDALALFTDSTLYQGGLDDLVIVARETHVPVVSQDYIVDEYQVVEARAAGASALLLYSSILDRPQLRTLVSATQRNRMTAIVEVRDLPELEYALSLSPYVIALTPDDPRTPVLNPDSLTELRAMIPSSSRVILSTPLASIEDVREAIKLKVHAVLIEENLLADPDYQAELNILTRRRKPGSNSQ